MKGEGRRSGAGKSAAVASVDGEMSEDEKIERFYALIRNYKEARRIEQERAAREGEVDDEAEARRKRKRTAKSADRAASTWIPAFKWEDFAESSQIRLPNTCNGMHGAGERLRAADPAPPEADGGGLDLKLRL